MVVRERLSYKAIHDVLSGLLEQDLHAKRVNSLCDATLGVLHSGSLAICTIGQGLAAARSLKPKHEDVLVIIDAIQTPYKWALIERPPLQHCSVGRVVLLGDAFHPTLPVLGQGANMAIEDGMILSRCLEASSGVDEALQRYEVARLDRTSRIVQSAFERLIQTRDELSDPDSAHPFMDRQFKSASGDPYEWIHQYDAVSAPI